MFGVKMELVESVSVDEGGVCWDIAEHYNLVLLKIKY